MTPSVTADLLERTQSGDIEAFGRFYDETVFEIIRWFTRRTAAADTAADLTAETYASALAALPRYDASKATSPAAWLQGIARYELLGWLRQREVEQRAMARFGIVVSSVHEDELDLVELRADLESAGCDLVEALSALSKSVRDAVDLRVMHELPYRDVSARLGCSEGAARVRVSRGLAQLWDALGGDEL